MAQKFHFAILRIEVSRASRGLSAIAELLVDFLAGFVASDFLYQKLGVPLLSIFSKCRSLNLVRRILNAK